MDSEWFQLKGEQIDLYDVVHSDGLRVYSPFLQLKIWKYFHAQIYNSSNTLKVLSFISHDIMSI